MTIKQRLTALERQAVPEDKHPIETALKAAIARHRAGIVRQWSESDPVTPAMAAARARVERMLAEQAP